MKALVSVSKLQTRIKLDFLSFSVSLQVDIVPSQGEISVGESKFFLCQGKYPRHPASQETHPAGQRSQLCLLG